MRPSRTGLVTAGIATVLCLGTIFALPASALPGDDPNCPEGPSKTCTQTPPELCPANTVSVPAPAGSVGTVCKFDSLVRARASAELLTQDELLKLCADARVRGLVNVRIAVGHPKWEIITLDGRTCKPPKPVPTPTTEPTPEPSVVPPAPAPVIVNSSLPVTH